MARDAAGFPNAPMIDGAGNLAPVWRAFLLALYTRTGSGEGVSSAATAAALNAETGARVAADTLLSAAEAAERAARTAADSDEAKARVAADAALGVRISVLSSAPVPQDVLGRIWFAR